MVWHVECLEAEFQVALFLEPEQLCGGQIPAYLPRSSDCVTAGASIGAERLQDICPGVEETLWILLAARQRSRLPGGVWSVVLMAAVTLVLSIENRDRKTRLQGNEGAELPPAGEGANDTATIQKRPSLAERYFVRQRNNEAVSIAETGNCAVTAACQSRPRSENIRIQ
jgi:hypothetical protein